LSCRGHVLGFGAVLRSHAALFLHAHVCFDPVTHMLVMQLIQWSAHVLTCRSDCSRTTVMVWLYSCTPGSHCCSKQQQDQAQACSAVCCAVLWLACTAPAHLQPITHMCW
jgi:hypothetical protein